MLETIYEDYPPGLESLTLVETRNHVKFWWHNRSCWWPLHSLVFLNHVFNCVCHLYQVYLQASAVISHATRVAIHLHSQMPIYLHKYQSTCLSIYLNSTWSTYQFSINLPTSLLSCCHQVHLRDHRPQRGKWLVALRQNGRGAQGSRDERYAVIEAMTDHAATARSGDNTLSAGVTWFEWNVVQYENLYSFLKISPLKSIKSSQFRESAANLLYLWC